jgi:5-formyltetrahydrofolate cyclo-ligase
MTSASPTGGSAAKRRLRAAVLAGRDALSPERQSLAAAALARHAARLAREAGGHVVAGYWPWRSEIDPRPLMHQIAALGLRLALPVIAHPHMLFRPWVPGTDLVDAGFGTLGPPPEAGEVTPDALIVPLAVFSRRGDRVGWGKGHYDRAIARLGAVRTFGVAHALQERAVLPVEDHDRPLDHVLTDREWIDCRAARRE